MEHPAGLPRSQGRATHLQLQGSRPGTTEEAAVMPLPTRGCHETRISGKLHVLKEGGVRRNCLFLKALWEARGLQPSLCRFYSGVWLVEGSQFLSFSLKALTRGNGASACFWPQALFLQLSWQKHDSSAHARPRTDLEYHLGPNMNAAHVSPTLG